MNKEIFNDLKAIAGLLFVLILLAFAVSFYNVGPKLGPRFEKLSEIKTFASCNAMASAFRESQSKRDYGFGVMKIATGAITPLGAKETGAEYSTTNIQVEGVDEADIVKTDGKYIYMLSNGKLVIAEAYPEENAKILSKTDLEEVNPMEIFIYNDTVLVFGSRHLRSEEIATPSEWIDYYPYHYRNFTTLQLWDVSNRTQPELKKSVDFEGKYVTSRKIGSNAYFVISSYPNYIILEKNPEYAIPMYRENNEELTPISLCTDIGYLEPMNAQAFITVGSISLSDFDAEIKKEVVVGSAQNVYASMENLYVAQTNYYYSIPIPLVEDLSGESQKTSIHKFSLKDGEISYQGNGEVPGHILNQFSMDEFEGYFRIATTIGHVTRQGGETSNNVYVLDSELNIVGKLEGLAPEEKIYSARFVGKKAYLVTFKKVDPLFVIDMSSPQQPKVLGKLKIPGYSDYLHPIDETHILGLGKETVEAEEGNFAWYQGIKMAIFDVSDVEKPKELFKTVIGDRGTDSYALKDHKAFLYDKRKNLLVIPVTVAEIDKEKYPNGIPANAFGDFVFQGAYVYNLTLENGFDLKGKITHLDNDELLKKSGYYFYGDGNSIKRSLFVDNVLYTVSDNKIKLNSLDDLQLLKELRIE